ncbi:MAG: hypothetical protein A2W52_01145 [Candidatus Taylorbacteria bacterium RIFCSPHIGHO2_02_49_25]|uniref:Methyltransferase FkbM domain-containing protein n=1 Tax=Candidatus Taylorbacteria bacterium RIFCSPHIGHO2_02_49_25 TaxID=1802305 RepID=A0A1G2MCX5_9BACT|nr:MAG: SAM-dependent methyltransferase [Parcubacteria group bacterium GW2011_GWF2_50_9]OHA19182.1 MAG: hypothetical protein A2759_00635 [Candidatus Taylorbacteria bacterium RIFCSPHIGHO2_01_FULL_49_60]OHA20989.1 MAG: hypothetical protein A2W52_01145 [Candidatus Taylorbacteria bacterium RIFCSPHIGHO2_02_49_25]OHA36760.1 MAG: hypothetical protein A3B27_01695 [Candidatus Taylorbacteria bacterium RIFCSPLOWO2_01_FULL_50_130]OHA37288.1 MAG: hypothetical protein A2W65_03390 [Candidatus Taylorbacteria b
MELTRLQHVLSRVRTYVNWPTVVWPLNRLLPKERIMRMRNGSRLFVRDVFGPDGVVVLEQFFRDDYGFANIDLSARAPVVLDLGANIGAFSIFALDAVRARGGKIFAFEPDEANFKVLQKNIALNNAEGIIIPVKEAISESDGVQEFFLSGQAYAHSLVKEQLHGKSVGSQRVPCTTIESILTRYALPRVDLIKMDIEGSEYEVLYQLPAALYQKIRNIVLEIHVQTGYAPEELIRFLEKQRFTVSVSSGNSHVYAATRAQCAEPSLSSNDT